MFKFFKRLNKVINFIEYYERSILNILNMLSKEKEYLKESQRIMTEMKKILDKQNGDITSAM